MTISTSPQHFAGPERPGGQGLDPNQEESGNHAILKLLTTEDGRSWTDFVATVRVADDGSAVYEAWAARGLVRWVRRFAAAGTGRNCGEISRQAEATYGDIASRQSARQVR